MVKCEFVFILSYTTTMEPNKKLSPLYFFLSLGVVVSLITSVSAFLTVCFEALEKAMPDVLNSVYQYGYNTYSYESLRSALSILIIVFPIFLVLHHFWIKVGNNNLSDWSKTIRRWAIYLILFLASVTVIVDLITLVRYFVSGEVTARFLIKIAIVLITAAIAGLYYAQELRRPLGEKFLKAKFYAIGSSILVLGAIIFSFCIMGSPLQQRDLRLDQRRVEDLQSIQWQIINFWQQKERLPNNLGELANPISSYTVPVDPEFESGRSYRYSTIDKDTFVLCADFSLDRPEGWEEYSGGGMRPMPMMADNTAEVSVAPSPNGMQESWDHQAGPSCFERTIDPDLYPPFPKPAR